MNLLSRLQHWLYARELPEPETEIAAAPGPGTSSAAETPDSSTAGPLLASAAEPPASSTAEPPADEREQSRRWRELRCHYLAAEASARAGDWQQAARSYHQSGAFAEAAACWERWLGGPEHASLGEEQIGAVLADVALCHDRLGQSRRAAALYRQALELLDVFAARHEEAERHQQARAAYLAIAHIGHSKGAYESIACGLAGAIRVSKRSGRAEGLMLGYYDDFIHYAGRFGEHAAAAELCVEAAELGAGQGSTRAYLIRAAENWLRNGDFLQVHLERPQLAESSYHAAIECYLRAREPAELAACYQRLAVVADPGRRAEFAQLAQALSGPVKTGRPQASARREQDPAALLEAGAEDPPEKVQKAYFQKIRRHPPDTDFERFEALSQAFDVLSDEKKRKRHAELFGKA